MPRDPHLLTCSRLDFSDDFQLIVGSDEATKKYYHVHRTVLVKSSDFFKRACNKEWEEGQSKIIKLPEVEPEIFDVYLQLLYTGEVVPAEEYLPSRDDNSIAARGEIARQHWILIEAYLLADMLLDTKSKNAIMDYLIEALRVTQKMPSPETITDVFKRTIDTSPMRRLLIDFVALKVDPKSFKSFGTLYSPEFLVDVGLRLMEYKSDTSRRTSPSKSPRCAYHEHDEADSKCSEPRPTVETRKT